MNWMMNETYPNNNNNYYYTATATAATPMTYAAPQKPAVLKKVMIIIATGALAFTMGAGVAKVCSECFTEGVAYADPVPQETVVDEPTVGLLAETLKSMGE